MRSASESERDYESESMEHESEEERRRPCDVGEEKRNEERRKRRRKRKVPYKRVFLTLLPFQGVAVPCDNTGLRTCIVSIGGCRGGG